MTDQTTDAQTCVPDETRIFFTHEVARDFHGRARVNALREAAEQAVREEPKGAEIWFKELNMFDRSFGIASSISLKGTLDITVGYVPKGLRGRVISLAEHRASNREAAERAFAEGNAENAA